MCIACSIIHDSIALQKQQEQPGICMTPDCRPLGGYNDIKPVGNQCVVGGGVTSDWAYPCTQVCSNPNPNPNPNPTPCTQVCPTGGDGEGVGDWLGAGSLAVRRHVGARTMHTSERNRCTHSSAPLRAHTYKHARIHATMARAPRSTTRRITLTLTLTLTLNL